MKEIWKTYHDGPLVKYDVSNKGRVRKNGKLYDCKPNNTNYLCFPYGFVHRAVAELFIPNPDNKPCIDHIDCNKHNNDVTNLRWVTHKENNNNPLPKQHNSQSNKKRLQLLKENNPEYYNKIVKTTQNKVYINKNNKNKMIDKSLLDDYLKDGWQLGEIMDKTYFKSQEFKKKMSEVTSGDKNPCYGKICVTNKIENKFINTEELDIYLNKGYVKGLTRKNKNTN